MRPRPTERRPPIDGLADLAALHDDLSEDAITLRLGRFDDDGEPQERDDRRALDTGNGVMGDPVGTIAGAQDVPPEATAQSTTLGARLRAASHPRLAPLTGRSPATQVQARAKLGTRHVEALGRRGKTAAPAPGFVRAVPPSRKTAVFPEVVGPQPGDAMYLAPEERVVIW